MLRRAVAFLSGGAVGLTVAGVTSVACHPVETPYYLVPYYLRSAKSRFRHFATVRESSERYMTPRDFVRSLLLVDDVTESEVNDISGLMTSIDSDDDRRISLGEYNFLVALLSTSPRMLKIAFQMFDIDDHRSITKEQLGTMVTALSDRTAPIALKNGFTRALFGKRDRVTLTEVEAAVHQIRQAIAVAEFRHIDSARRGSIPRESFGTLIASHHIGSHLPFFVVRNIRHMSKDSEAPRVTETDWLSFMDAMERADELADSLEIFYRSHTPVRKPQLNQAAIVSLGHPLAPVVVDLLFDLFDGNGDGTIEMDEFLSVMQSRVRFHSHPPPAKDRASLPTQLVKCTRAMLDS